jgi:hypothetical protein
LANVDIDKYQSIAHIDNCRYRMEPVAMNNVLAWMAALGIQLDDHQPDARQLEHIAATRAAKAQNRSASSRLTRVARAVGLMPVAQTAAEPTTCACAA